MSWWVRIGHPSSSRNSRTRRAHSLTSGPIASRSSIDETTRPMLARKNCLINSFALVLRMSLKLQSSLFLRRHVAQQILANVLGICWRYRLVYFALCHPVNTHRVASRRECTIAPSRDGNKIFPFVGLPEMRLSAIKSMYFGVPFMRWGHNLKIRFKQTVSKYAKPRKHRTAKDNWIDQWCPVYVFHYIWEPGLNQNTSNWLNKSRPFVGVSISLGKIRIGLAGGDA